MRSIPAIASAATLLALTASCQPPDGRRSASAQVRTDPESPTIAAARAGAPFAGITADETIRLVGAEPFWDGTIRDGEMVYSTPENQAGDTLAVRRFAGNNGLGFNGAWNGAPLDLTVTPGSCSDGMSDRTYPFTVTLRLGEEQRSGCAWTDRTPFSGPRNP